MANFDLSSRLRLWAWTACVSHVLLEYPQPDVPSLQLSPLLPCFAISMVQHLFPEMSSCLAFGSKTTGHYCSDAHS
jgi:hypothetical protein